MQWDEGLESTADVPRALSGGHSDDETFLPSFLLIAAVRRAGSFLVAV
jgi:hypothetical protein